MTVMPAAFFGHGNPMNALESNRYTEAWRAFGRAVPRPRAILVVSAHWYVHATAVTAMPRPRTIHDFFGFPRELFDVRYPPPGLPSLYEEVADIVKPTWVGADLDSWGIDHGTWSVLLHAFPDADIPVVQLSINALKRFDYHLQLGAALAPLREDGVLVIGSGNVVHNLGGVSRARCPTPASTGRSGSTSRRRSSCSPTPPRSAASTGTATSTSPSRRPTTSCRCCTSRAWPARPARQADVLVDGYAYGSLSMTAYTVGMTPPAGRRAPGSPPRCPTARPPTAPTSDPGRPHPTVAGACSRRAGPGTQRCRAGVAARTPRSGARGRVGGASASDLGQDGLELVLVEQLVGAEAADRARARGREGHCGRGLGVGRLQDHHAVGLAQHPVQGLQPCADGLRRCAYGGRAVTGLVDHATPGLGVVREEDDEPRRRDHLVVSRGAADSSSGAAGRVARWRGSPGGAASRDAEECPRHHPLSRAGCRRPCAPSELRGRSTSPRPGPSRVERAFHGSRPPPRVRRMTVKLVVLYTQPEQPEEFERHYTEQHVPLVHTIPGLQQFDAGRFVSAGDGGELSYYRIAELTFADQGALEAALASEESQAAAADYDKIAPLAHDCS